LTGMRVAFVDVGLTCVSRKPTTAVAFIARDIVPAKTKQDRR
jgi:hypothetical protein